MFDLARSSLTWEFLVTRRLSNTSSGMFATIPDLRVYHQSHRDFHNNSGGTSTFPQGPAPSTRVRIRDSGRCPTQGRTGRLRGWRREWITY